MKKAEIRKKAYGLAVCLFAFLLSACSGLSVRNKQERTLFAMDTVMSLCIYGSSSDLDASETLIKSIEKQLSVTDSQSDIHKLNESGTFSVSSEVHELIEKALDMCEQTDGALDITIYPVVKAWGFTTGEYRIPESSELNGLLNMVDYSKVKLSEEKVVSLEKGMELDLGSVAKGYTGDRLMLLLKEQGVKSALVNLGGNVHTLGRKPDGSLWRIAIADPDDISSYLGYVEIEDKAVVTSGAYQRNFEESGKKYHHIIDPQTGYPASNGLKSVTVIGESGFECDALSTALFVMGLERSIDFCNNNDSIDAILVADDGTVYITKELENIFVIQNGASVKVILK